MHNSGTTWAPGGPVLVQRIIAANTNVAGQLRLHCSPADGAVNFYVPRSGNCETAHPRPECPVRRQLTLGLYCSRQRSRALCSRLLRSLRMTDLKWLEKYSGQTVEQLLSLEGEYRTDSVIIAFEQAIGQKA